MNIYRLFVLLGTLLVWSLAYGSDCPITVPTMENPDGTLIASGQGSSVQLMQALEAGEHVGLLVDQKFKRGIQIPFLGKDAPTNTLLAKLARRDDCPVHGARSVRLPNGRFRLEITNELELPRDENGDVDIRGTTELITGIIEGWVREYPDQWLWMHRRWG